MTGSRATVSRRAGVAVALAVLIVSGCSGPIATPSSVRATAPRFTFGLPSPLPSPSDGPTLEPSPSPTAQPPSADVPSWLQGDFEVAMGNLTGLTPTDDLGSAAGLQIDDFGMDLLRKLESSGHNLCISPTSIALSLAMVRAGAKGQTAAEMDKVLHGFGSPADEAAVLSLVNQLQSRTMLADADGVPIDPDTSPGTGSPVVELNLANEAFLQQGSTFERSYLDTIYSEFNAGAGLLDFASAPEHSRMAINAWASKLTHGRIPEVLHSGDVTDATRIALANAIYFKAAWHSRFDPKNTAKRAFTTSSGQVKYVPTMSGTVSSAYAAGKDYKAVALSYSGSFDMVVIVPSNLSAFVKSADAARLGEVISALQPYDVQLTMPRFSLDTRAELSPVLSAMGMPTVFTPAADLTGISSTLGLDLSHVIHQANIDVVEDGTTAAAVTVALGATTGGGMDTPPTVKFHIDRPFLYFIRDLSGAVLFEGVVNDPTSK